MESADWLFKIGDRVHGPVSHVELQKRAAAGEIGPDTPVRKEGHGQEWQRAGSLSFLSSAFAAVQQDATMPGGAVASAKASSPPIPPTLIAGRSTPKPSSSRTSALLVVAIGLLAVSVILQGIMCAAVLWFQKEMTKRMSGVPVNITNTEVPVEITNWEVPVNVRNHYVIKADPIPVTIVR